LNTKRMPLLIIFLTVLIDMIGFGMLLPLLPYYAESFAHDVATLKQVIEQILPFYTPAGTGVGVVLGLLFSIYSLMQFIFAPILGRLSDRFGRRPIILLSLSGNFISYIIMAFAPNLWVLFLSRFLAGITGANISASQAYIADVTPPEKRAQGMGLIGAAFGLGFILGPALSGILSIWGFTAPALGAAVLVFIDIVLATLLLHESHTPSAGAGKKSFRRFNLSNLVATLRHPVLGILIGVFFLSTFAFVMFETVFAVFGETYYNYDSRSMGYVFAYAGVIMVIFQGMLIGRLTRRFGEKLLLVSGIFILGLGLFFISLIPATQLYLFGAIALLAVGNGLIQPTNSSLISKSAPADTQGGVLGVAQGMSSLARVVGPPLAGFFYDSNGKSSPFWIGALILFFAALVLITSLPRLETATNRSA